MKKLIDHIVRHEGLLKLIIEGKSVEGKNYKGKPRLEYTYIQQIIKDQGCNLFVKMKRKVDNKEEWRMTTNRSTD